MKERFIEVMIALRRASIEEFLKHHHNWEFIEKETSFSFISPSKAIRLYISKSTGIITEMDNELYEHLESKMKG